LVLIRDEKKMTEEEKNYREIEKREKIVQILLIIGGFFVAYSSDENKTLMIIIFVQFLLFVLLYYVFISTTKLESLVNWLAFSTSLFYSFFMTFYLKNLIKLDDWSFLIIFILLGTVLTFALVYPGSSENLTWKIYNYLDRKQVQNPSRFKKIFMALSILAIIILIIEVIWIYI
jgi:hypothetical protein